MVSIGYTEDFTFASIAIIIISLAYLLMLSLVILYNIYLIPKIIAYGLNNTYREASLSFFDKSMSGLLYTSLSIFKKMVVCYIIVQFKSILLPRVKLTLYLIIELIWFSYILLFKVFKLDRTLVISVINQVSYLLLIFMYTLFPEFENVNTTICLFVIFFGIPWGSVVVLLLWLCKGLSIIPYTKIRNIF